MVFKKSQVYAQALFELEASGKILKPLKELSSLFHSPEFLDFFLSFTISQKDKKKLLEKILKSAPLLLKNFFYVVLDNRAFQILPEIVEAYQKLLEEKEKTCTGLIYSSQPLSLDQKQEVEKSLEKFFNKKLDLKQKEDKSLIGGFYIQVGGFLFDSTVKQQLKQFKRKGA